MPSNLFSMDSNGYRLLLPEGTLDYFDLVDVQETSIEVVIYLEEKNIEMLPKALEYLKEAATVGKSDMAMYVLGNVYSDNEYGMKDKLEAEKWYRMAEKEGNGYAALYASHQRVFSYRS